MNVWKFLRGPWTVSGVKRFQSLGIPLKTWSFHTIFTTDWSHAVGNMELMCWPNARPTQCHLRRRPLVSKTRKWSCLTHPRVRTQPKFQVEEENHEAIIDTGASRAVIGHERLGDLIKACQLRQSFCCPVGDVLACDIVTCLLLQKRLVCIWQCSPARRMKGKHMLALHNASSLKNSLLGACAHLALPNSQPRYWA